MMQKNHVLFILLFTYTCKRAKRAIGASPTGKTKKAPRSPTATATSLITSSLTDRSAGDPSLRPSHLRLVIHTCVPKQQRPPYPLHMCSEAPDFLIK